MTPKITVTLTAEQHQTLKQLAYWAQTSDSITEEESAVLDHLLAKPAPFPIPEGKEMREFRLEPRGVAPITFSGVLLTPQEILGTYVLGGVHVFRTQAGEYLLYVASVGYQTTTADVQRLYRNADKMTSQEVISACVGGRGNNAASDAKYALQALGLDTEQRIA